MVELKDLIAVPNIAERLRRPAKTDKVLGPRKDSWCEFHEAFGHQIDNCLSLGYQLDEPAHEMHVLGEVHTIAGGFSVGGPTASQRKKYARGVNSIEERLSGEPWESDIVISEMWYPTTTTPLSSQSSQPEGRCTECLSTKEVR